MANRRITRPAVLIPLLTVAVIVGGVGLYLFQPWKLFVDETVDEAAPVAVSTTVPTAPSDGDEPAAASEAAEPVVLSAGTFISHEHTTTGTVQILELPDGTRVLRIENLDTSNGPDLKVWLTDAPVIEGRAGWGVFDDGAWVDLGSLKGNQGSQNYEIPAEVNLADFSSVSIWCDRFNVSFGAAELL
jgi:hypothetical protein